MSKTSNREGQRGEREVGVKGRAEGQTKERAERREGEKRHRQDAVQLRATILIRTRGKEDGR